MLTGTDGDDTVLKIRREGIGSGEERTRGEGDVGGERAEEEGADRGRVNPGQPAGYDPRVLIRVTAMEYATFIRAGRFGASLSPVRKRTFSESCGEHVNIM